jgi:hypothetical protein
VQWESLAEEYRRHENNELFRLEECIDDLKGILPPEEEG